MGSQTLELKWANHKSNMTSQLQELYLSDALLDVTIACGEYSLRAHKAVLSASSTFFRKLFINNPCKHPILIMTDVDFEDLKSIVEFMYQGVVHISREKLSHFLKIADRLMVKGLTSIENISLIPSEHFETDVYPRFSDEDRMEPQPQSTNNKDIQNSPGSVTECVENTTNKEVPVIKLEDDTTHSNTGNCTYWENECFDRTLSSSIVPDSNLSSSSASHQQMVSTSQHHSPAVSVSHQLSTSLSLLNASIAHPLASSASHELVIPSTLDKTVNSCSSHQPEVPFVGEGFKHLDKETDSALLTQVHEESTGSDVNPVCMYPSRNQSTVTVSAGAKTSFETIESLSGHSSQVGKRDSEVSTDPSTSVSAVRSNTHCLNIVALQGLGKTSCSSSFKYIEKTTHQVLKESNNAIGNHGHSAEIQSFPIDEFLSLPMYVCEFCNKSFTEQNFFKKHLKLHSKLRRYICKLCNYRFALSSDLQRHIRIHTGERPFSCRVCNKRFSQRPHLEYHEKTHTGEKPFECRHCSDRFRCRSELNRHVKCRHIMENTHLPL